MTITPEQPAILRDAISHEMAFPVGYEWLRERFGDLPTWPGAKFRFKAHPTTSATDFTRILRALEPYPILRVEHRPEEHRGIDHIFAGWWFTVYPVRRHLKNSARQTLGGVPLATLRDFMAALPKPLPHYYLRRDVVFDPVSRDCTVGAPFTRPAPLIKN